LFDPGVRLRRRCVLLVLTASAAYDLMDMWILHRHELDMAPSGAITGPRSQIFGLVLSYGVALGIVVFAFLASPAFADMFL